MPSASCNIFRHQSTSLVLLCRHLSLLYPHRSWACAYVDGKSCSIWKSTHTACLDQLALLYLVSSNAASACPQSLLCPFTPLLYLLLSLALPLLVTCFSHPSTALPPNVQPLYATSMPPVCHPAFTTPLLSLCTCLQLRRRRACCKILIVEKA